VAQAQTFVTRGPERSVLSPTVAPNLSIPDNDATGITSSITIPSNIQVERVQVVLTAPHPRIGDLRITLTSPSGSTSLLADQRSDARPYNAFTFTSVRHWDERGHGVWTLRIADVVAGNTGSLGSWQLRVYGGAPACPGDWNATGHLEVQDIFDFLNDWFAGNADFNNDGAIQVQDIFDFLNAWFAGC
jgi:subtilisin-like proprotein convertase family protein